MREFEVIGLLDQDRSHHDQEVDGIRVLGGDDLLPRLLSQGVQTAFLGVGGIGDNRPRAKIFERIRSIGLCFAKVVHPSAVVADSVELGEGVVLFAGAIVNSGARLGKNVIVNTGAIVDHDVILGDHVHIATGAVLSGGVRVGAYSHIGTGACVRQNIAIGSRALIAVGAAVVTDVRDDETVAGVPARLMILQKRN